MTDLRDSRGCLTDAGLDALANAPVGQTPAELAGHVASCARCQDRALLRATGNAVRPRRREPPPPWRLYVVLALALLTLVGVLLTLRRLA